MVGSEGSLGAIWAPRLTYFRCKSKNLGAFVPVKGEPCELAVDNQIYNGPHNIM